MPKRHRYLLLSLLLILPFVAPLPSAAQACDHPLKISFITIGSAFSATSFTVADPNSCGWQTVVESGGSGWITVTYGFSGRGTGTVRLNASAYTGNSFRAAVLRAGNEFVVVRQNSPGLSSTVSVSPSTLFVGSSFSAETVAVTAPPTTPWRTASVSSFITLTNGFSGSGDGSVSVNVLANSATPRVGLVTIGTAILAVVQKGPAAVSCDRSLTAVSPTTATFDASGGQQTVRLDAPPICSSTAASSSSWLTVSPRQAVGPQTFVLAATASAAARAATLVIGGHSVAVSQRAPAPPTCARSVTPTLVDVPATGGTVPITVNSVNCPGWSVMVPAGVTASPSSGTGTAQVRLVVGSNAGTARSLVVNAAGTNVTLRQAAQSGCPRAALSATTLSFSRQGGSKSIRIDTKAGCDWGVVGAPSDVTTTPAAGAGPGTVTIGLPANLNPQDRTFLISIGGVEVTVSQERATCDYFVTTTTLQLPRVGGSITSQVTASPGCGAASVTVPSWVAILERTDPDGSGTITLTVAANPAPAARLGTVRIGQSSLRITQAGEPPNGTTFDGSNISIPWTLHLATATWRGSDGTVRQWAMPGDLPSPTDGDGDGRLDIRVMRVLPGTSVFYLLPSSGTCPALYDYEGHTGDGHPVCRRFFGRAGDIPLRFIGDDDRFDDIAVYRVATNTLLLTTSTGTCPATIPPSEIGFDGRWICAATFGLAGDKVLTADVTGDQKTDLVVWRPSSGYFHILPSDGVCPVNGCQIQWGLAGDQPVLPRFIDRAASSFAVYRPSEGNWYLASFNGACPASFRSLGPAHSGITACVRNLGLSSDVPVFQDYDGDGFDDVAVFRPGSSDWFLAPSSGTCPAAVPNRFINSDGNAACRTNWGTAGSVPITGTR